MTYIWIYVTIGIYYLQVATSQRNYGDNRKPGRCPAVPPDPKGTCVDLPICSEDSDCYGVKKCCRNGCGHECLFPVDPKPGICPPSGGGHCAEHCSKDSDCQDVQKCCSNGCGHDCFFPVTVKPGTCPTLPPDTVGTCVDLCSLDSDCLGDQKCCSHGCGHSCSSPEPEFCPTCCGPPPCCSTCITCEIGEPQPNVYCNSSNQLVCAKSYYCKIFSPKEDFGVCCKVPQCPVDLAPNSNCYGRYRRSCSDDSSCPLKTKCCKQGCSYKCVDAV